MISSGICACGRPADSFGGLCDRCVALQTLGLVNTASAEQIENAYRTLVKVWHPDRFQSDPRVKQAADEKLKEINAAHDYLVSAPSKPQSAATVRKPGSGAPQEESFEPPQYEPTPFVHHADAEEPEEVRRILRRYKGHKSTMPRALVTSGIALSAVAVLALLWFIVDGFLSSNQSTALAWTRKKTELSLELHAAGTRLWSGAADNLKDSNSQISPMQAPSSAESNPTVAPPPSNSPEQRGTHEHGTSSAQTVSLQKRNTGAQPYITAGLSPAEVLAVLGNPTSSAGQKMFYKGSEIDFQNGQVVGWKIDPRSAPLRVKLWPETAPAPGLTTFRVGSSKSDVIALQGTPTLFSPNEFGYGASVVFFQNDHVVGWKEDPSSVPLKAAR